RVALVGPEVPAVGEGFGATERLGEHEVATERAEYVLPRPHCRGVADTQRFAIQRSAYQVGHEALGSPVSAADDVAGSSGGETGTVRAGEEGAPVRAHDQLRRPLGARVGVVAAHRVTLAIAPFPPAILVALVRRHDDN